MSVQLDDITIDRIAERTAELVLASLAAGNGTPGAIDTKEAARRLGRSPEWVRDHRAELGGFPLGPTGDGKRPRLGFDPRRIEEFKKQPPRSTESQPRSGVNRLTAESRRRIRTDAVDLLPIRGRRP